MNRRLFLGLVGGTIAAAATPAEFFALTEAAPALGRRLITEVLIQASDIGLYTLSRANVLDGSWLLAFGIGTGGMCRWVSCPGNEIVLVPGEPQLRIDGPSVPQWDILYTDDAGHRYSATSRGDIVPLDVRLGARAHRRRNLRLV